VTPWPDKTFQVEVSILAAKTPAPSGVDNAHQSWMWRGIDDNIKLVLIVQPINDAEADEEDEGGKEEGHGGKDEG